MSTYTTASLFYPSSADYTFGDPMPDYLRCYPTSAGGGGSQEVALPQVEAGAIGQRITLANLSPGSTSFDVLVNPVAGEYVAGQTTTYHLKPGKRVTLQAVAVESPTVNGYGWEVVSA